MEKIENSQNLPTEISEDSKVIKIAMVGHVDHGKSTLIGRLLYDTDSLPDGKFEAIKAMSARRGMPLEFAFVMDAFQAERDQAVTIDSSYTWFKSKKRNYVLVDSPGHTEFLKNMVSGVANCDAAVLVVDALEGVCEQTRRHAYLLHMLGITKVIVAVNKMDTVSYQKKHFDSVKDIIRSYLYEIGLEALEIVPVVAREGCNITKNSREMEWYSDSTILEALDQLELYELENDRPLRMPVQDIYHFDSRRIIAGRLESGSFRVGDKVLFSPSNRKARIASIESWPAESEIKTAVMGISVGITLDEKIFIERGEVMSHLDEAPLESNVFCALIFWLGNIPLKIGDEYKIKIGPFEANVEVQSIQKSIDIDNPNKIMPGSSTTEINRNGLAELILRSKTILPLDEYTKNPKTGRFVLMHAYDVVGGGIINMKGYPDQRDLITEKGTNLFAVGHRVPASSRSQRNGHIGGVVWLTGLSGSGKSSIALEVERILFQKGYNVYLLDGDNVRSGLNANLSFSPEDRAENIRRVGEVAALFADAGMVVITAFISPYRADRTRAREAMGRLDDNSPFREIFIKASLNICEERDPKGLYKKARSGELTDFTGISAPYEEPDSPDLIIDTSNQSIEASVEHLVNFILQEFQMSVSG